MLLGIQLTKSPLLLHLEKSHIFRVETVAEQLAPPTATPTGPPAATLTVPSTTTPGNAASTQTTPPMADPTSVPPGTTQQVRQMSQATENDES